MGSKEQHWHVPALDGLRGIAVLVVILCHAPPTYQLHGGHIGVDLFFVLSGFLITSILLNEWRSTGRISIPHFYLRRACRLFPAAFSVLLFATAAAPFIQPAEELHGRLKDAAAVLLYVFNWRLVDLYTGGVVYFHNHMLSHYWSLSVEEQFYLVWPALLLLLLRLRAPRIAMIAFFAAGIIAPAAGRALLWEHGPSPEIYFRSDLRVDGLMWGAALAWLAHQNLIPANLEVRRYAGLVGFSALSLFLYLSQFDMVSDGSNYQWGFSLVGLLAALMIGSTIVAPHAIFSRLLGLGWLRWTGKISYGLYLWHVPAFVLTTNIPVSANTRMLIVFASTFGVAALSFRYYETPFLKLKERFGYAPPKGYESRPRASTYP